MTNVRMSFNYASILLLLWNMSCNNDCEKADVEFRLHIISLSSLSFIGNYDENGGSPIIDTIENGDSIGIMIAKYTDGNNDQWVMSSNLLSGTYLYEDRIKITCDEPISVDSILVESSQNLYAKDIKQKMSICSDYSYVLCLSNNVRYISGENSFYFMGYDSNGNLHKDTTTLWVK